MNDYRSEAARLRLSVARGVYRLQAVVVQHAWDTKEIRKARKTENRKTSNPTAPQSRKETSARTAPNATEQKVVALAEQMGRLIGTVQGRAEGWRSAVEEAPSLQPQAFSPKPPALARMIHE